MPGTIEIPYRRICPSRNLLQFELVSKIFGDCAKQSVQPQVAGQRRLVQKHCELEFWCCRQIEFVEEFRERLVERLARRDALSGLCEGSWAHRLKCLRKKDVLARSAACQHPTRCSERTRRELRWPVRRRRDRELSKGERHRPCLAGLFQSPRSGAP